MEKYQCDLEQKLPKELYAFLLRWANLCNPSDGGISHPLDRERWFDFLIAVHQYQREHGKGKGIFSSEDLGKWLRGDYQRKAEFSTEAVNKLERDYDYSMELLKRYKDIQG